MSQTIEFKNDLNLTIFGCSGIGKSSLLNNIMNYCKASQNIKKFAKVRDDQTGQLTTKFEKYVATPKFKIFDTLGWNWEKNNFSTDLFSKMLQGLLNNLEDLEKPTFRKQPDPYTTMNSVAFVVNQNLFSEKYIQYLKPYYEITKKLKKMCLFVVTFIDELDDVKEVFSKSNEFTDIASAINKSKKYKEIQRFIRDNIDKDVIIIPMINYTFDSTFSSSIQRDDSNFLVLSL